MGARPESMRGLGTTVLAPIPTKAQVTGQGYDPAKLATGATFSFGPTPRAVVDEAVAAFDEGARGGPPCFLIVRPGDREALRAGGEEGASRARAGGTEAPRGRQARRPGSGAAR